MPESQLGRTLQSYFVESLGSRLDALEATRVKLQNEPLEAASSIQRIARTLSDAGIRFGFPEISRRARQIESCSPHAVGAHLEDLMRAVRDAVNASQEGRLRILIVEPETDTADLLQVMLTTPNRDVTAIPSPSEALRAARENEFALIILALNLPDADGRDLLVRLRERQQTAVTPIFVLSDRRDPVIETECFALGADHFVVKPFDPPSLSSAVNIRLQRQVSTRSKDPLTGLPDKIALADAFDRIAPACRQSDTPWCLALIAVDHFDAIRDTYGLAQSEEILRHTADLVDRSLDNSCLLGRWEDETFLVLFPDTPPTRAAGRLDRVLQTIRHERFLDREREPIPVTCSTGLVRVPPNADTIAMPLRDALYFLWHARSHGGSRVSAEGEATAATKEIVLVEDDALISVLVEDRLQREGYEVRSFDDALAARDALDQMNPALFLLDVKLPGMSGFELLTHLRRVPSYAQTPVVMLTAMSGEKNVVRGFELGADDYLLKPFSPTELVARVRRLLT